MIALDQRMASRHLRRRRAPAITYRLQGARQSRGAGLRTRQENRKTDLDADSTQTQPPWRSTARLQSYKTVKVVAAVKWRSIASTAINRSRVGEAGGHRTHA